MRKRHSKGRDKAFDILRRHLVYLKPLAENAIVCKPRCAAFEVLERKQACRARQPGIGGLRDNDVEFFPGCVDEIPAVVGYKSQSGIFQGLVIQGVEAM